jgi:hypothetical protein
MSTTKLIRALQGRLIEIHAEGRQVVALIDEAHAMPLETLEEIRLLSNLETSQFKLMQIVLFGQPELDQHLSLQNMRQLRERITHSFNLRPLPPRDIKDYVNFRLRAAGYQHLLRQDASRRVCGWHPYRHTRLGQGCHHGHKDCCSKREQTPCRDFAHRAGFSDRWMGNRLSCRSRIPTRHNTYQPKCTKRYTDQCRTANSCPRPASDVCIDFGISSQQSRRRARR